MSQATDSDGAQTETEKTVTVLAYSDDPHLSEREFAQAIDPAERDFYDQRTTERSSTHLRWTDDDGEEQERYVIDQVFDVVVKKGAFIPDNDAGVEIVRETEEKTTYKHSPIDAARVLRDEVVQAVPDELSGGIERDDWHTRKWQTDLSETKVHVSGTSVVEMGVLAHQGERGGGAEMFEETDERPAVEFTIELTGTEDEVETWSEEMVEPFMTALGRSPGIGKVRVSDCTETVTRDGDCIGL